MTDPSSFIITHPIAHSFPVAAPPAQPSPLPNGTLSDTNVPEEEEYTIKCICGYADDDGNTVYCPKCDTWQHIECYYPSRNVPEDHFCADCLPRELDARRAAERQRRHREAVDSGDRKKRPTSKNHRKKHKDSISTTEQINGFPHERQEPLPNGRDQPPPLKKPKTSHRTSASIISLNGETRKRASSNLQSYPSPSKSPQDLHRYPPVSIYTSDFLELYDRDEGTTDAIQNEHTIQATNTLSALRSSPSLIANTGEQPSLHKPFVRAAKPIDSSNFPAVSVESVEKKEAVIDGKIPRWKYLKTQTAISKDDLVGEVKGEIGTLQEYCHQQSTPNRWQELGHPDPFVFFHPHMDIYIDSRKAGTDFRYLRRSCTPNVTLKTFVFDDGDWRHCFVARESIPEGKELTAAWFLDPQVMNSDPNTDQEKCDWVSRVLANFGDCACNKAAACYFARFDRRSSLKSTDSGDRLKAVKRRRPKPKNAISPMSTGQATNSRAGSEALKLEDEEQYDRNSSSGSAGTGSKSRDMTPTNNTVAALDADPVLHSTVTERELKKIKAAERLFEQATKSQKKKKRTSGGSNLNTPNNSSRQIGHSPYSLTPSGMTADQFSGSPPPRSALGHRFGSLNSRAKTSPQPPQRPKYASMGTQTDPEEDEMPAPKRRKFVTPTQQLLRKVLADRNKFEQQCKSDPSNLYRPSLSPTTSAPVVPTTSNDVVMKDVASGVSPVSVKSGPLPSPTTSSDNNSSPAVSPVYPLPSQAAHSHKQFKVPPASKLQLSTLPPVPTFSTSGPSGTPSTAASTPGGTVLSTVLSPAAISTGPTLIPAPPQAVTPSPAKKKLSLGDYISRRNTNSAITPLAEKAPGSMMPTTDTGSRKGSDGSMVQPSLGEEGGPRPKPDDSVKQEAAAQGGLEGSAIDDALMKDDPEGEEPEYVPPEPEVDTSSAPAPTVEAEVNKPAGPLEPVPLMRTEAVKETTPSAPPASTMSPEVSNVLAQLAQLHQKQRSQSAGSS